ncbi:MAG: hypothetical protein K0B02_02975 [DPANN group archaeon]|nr:hypothetical protein [DPANN group archaeon]
MINTILTQYASDLCDISLMEFTINRIKKNYENKPTFWVMNEFAFSNLYENKVSIDGNTISGNSTIEYYINLLKEFSKEYDQFWIFAGSVEEDMGQYLHVSMPIINNGEIKHIRRKMQIYYDIIDPNLSLNSIKNKFENEIRDEIRLINEKAQKESIESLTTLDIGKYTVLPLICNEVFSLRNIDTQQFKRLNLPADIIIESSFDNNTPQNYIPGLINKHIVKPESYLIKSDGYRTLEQNICGCFRISDNHHNIKIDIVHNIID